VLGTAAHGGFRFVTRRRRHPHGASARAVYLYSAYERSWHWLMAVSILLLMATGLSIHLGSSRGPWSLPVTVAVHNAVAVVLIANAFLSLFYHVTTAAIRQFLPSRQDLVGGILAQARFYARGIFLGQPHPTPKALDRKLNPLQQLTYLALLNILFPLQAVTGALIWTASRRPELVNAVGGLSVIAPLHDLGAWLFLAFFVLHLYLTTTGHTVLSNVKAMIDGWDEIDPIPPTKTGVLHV
jgi:thiosulfate reductase cytochrome b subunit